MINTFAKNLKNLRENAGISQQKLAESLCLTQRKISYWENGQAEPDLESLIQLARFFQITTDYLLGLED